MHIQPFLFTMSLNLKYLSLYSTYVLVYTIELAVEPEILLESKQKCKSKKTHGSVALIYDKTQSLCV